jgi:hypothetical protein
MATIEFTTRDPQHMYCVNGTEFPGWSAAAPSSRSDQITLICRFFNNDALAPNNANHIIYTYII